MREVLSEAVAVMPGRRVFRLVSLNLNGIRSAANKGFEAWAEGVDADCMGVQEIKAQAEHVTGRFDKVAGMTGHFHYRREEGLHRRRPVQPRSARARSGPASATPSSTTKGRYVEVRFDRAAGAACRA